MRVRLDRDGEGASQAEVRNLDHVLGLIDEKVLGLEVAVHDAVAVDVRAPEAQLVHEVLHDILLEGVRGPATGEVHETLEVLVEVLEDEVEHGLAVLLDVLHLEQPDHRGVGDGRRDICQRRVVDRFAAMGTFEIARWWRDAREDGWGKEGARDVRVPGRIGCIAHAPDDEGALAEHLQEGNLAESRGRHALLLHLRRDEGGRKMSVAVRAREGK